jgi:uncharacterized protein with HEPN domain
MPKHDRANLLAILDAVTKIQNYVRGFTESDELYLDTKSFDATMMNFIVIGEMVDRVSGETKERHPEVEWQEIKDFRNLVAHDYLGIDAEEVWQIVQNHLPKLRDQLAAILSEFAPEERA